MKHHLKYWAAAAAALLLTVSACNKKEENVKPNTEAQTEQAQAKQEVALDQLDRLDFNRAAVRLNLPVFWISEETPSKTLRPEALAALNFYPGSDSFTWKDDSGNFTPEFLAKQDFFMPVWFYCIMVVFISVTSMFGDLMASLIKRYYGVKDYSNLIPGHGGIMDRFDSVLLASPTMYAFLLIFGMVVMGA